MWILVLASSAYFTGFPQHWKYNPFCVHWALLHSLVLVTFTPVVPVLLNNVKVLCNPVPLHLCLPVPASFLPNSFQGYILSSRQQCEYLSPRGASAHLSKTASPVLCSNKLFSQHSYHWGDNLAFVSFTAIVWIWNVQHGSCVEDLVINCDATRRW